MGNSYKLLVFIQITILNPLIFRGNEVLADPTADFSYSFPSDCVGEQIQFINNSSTLSGSIILTIWDFGDGNSSAVSSPAHQYAASGNYTVKLTIQNSDGDFDVASQVILVNPIPQVNFQLAGSNQCESVQQTFDNLSSIPSNDLTYEWDFGDGNTSTDSDPGHQYASDGTYQVVLVATSASTSCESSISKQVTIHPEETVSFNSQNVCLGEKIDFENTSTQDATSVNWLWDFDDGNTSTKTGLAYTYTVAGDYDVSLQATTNKGCITSVTQSVHVYEQPVADFAANNGCFEVDASFTNTSQFTDSYKWYFGDGDTSNEANPTHSYTSYGTYQVSLVSSNSDGCRDSIGKELNIFPLPSTGFTTDDNCLGSATVFTNTSQITSGTLSYLWDFGDGSNSSQVNPQHDYTTSGIYTVKLRSTSEQGCFTEYQTTVEIHEQPSASFTVSDVCRDSAAIFVNTSTGSSVTYEWDFGDGQKSTDINPTHEYLVPGTYQVSLELKSGSGCTDEISTQVTIHPLPTVNFSFASVCDTVTVPFSNLSTISTGSIAYDWDFGDGATSSASEPTHLYSGPGAYTINLTGTSEKGCAQTKTREITIYPRPVAEFTTEEVCDGSLSLFLDQSTLTSGHINRYQWDFGDGSNSIVPNPEKQYFNNGDYEVSLTVFSDRGCESQVTSQVTVYEFPVADFEVDNVCFGLPISPKNTSEISSGDLNFSWDFGDGTTADGFSPSHHYGLPGVYTITLRAKASTGCTDSIQKDVRIYPLPEVSAGSDTSSSQGFPVQLSATGAVSYSWFPIDGLDNNGVSAPIATPSATTTYVVEGTDQYGCANSDSVTLLIENDYKLIASNVFTPDGNGQNDTWVIQNVEIFGTVNVRVYDRYGTLVFQDRAYQNDWSGTYGRDILPDGTYYYLVTFSDSPKTYKGALTILRNR